MQAVKKWVICLSLMLSACSSLPKVENLPRQAVDSQLFKIAQHHPKQEISLLAIQFSPNQWRWVQTDPLGAPIARLRLTRSGWENDGFIAPNRQAKWLFSALATALNPHQPLFRFSRIQPQNGRVRYEIDGKTVWEIQGNPKALTIFLSDHSQWRVEALEE